MKKSVSSQSIKYSYFFFIVTTIISLLFIIVVSVSCSAILSQPGTSVSGEGNNNDSGAVVEEPSQDTMGLEGEIVPEVDYQNATIGAEMVGTIPVILCTNRDNYIKIEITNTSDFTWRNERPGEVRLGYHYYGQDVEYVDYDGTQRTILPKEVNPGETIKVIMLINDIVNPGKYIVQIDPVLEGNEVPEDNFWFSSKGVEMIQGPVDFIECGVTE